MNKKVTRSIADGIYYTKFELVGPDLAFVVIFMTKMPIGDVAHTKVPSRQIDLVSDWTIHRRDEDGMPCTYFDKCSMYDAWHWGDESGSSTISHLTRMTLKAVYLHAWRRT